MIFDYNDYDDYDCDYDCNHDDYDYDCNHDCIHHRWTDPSPSSSSFIRSFKIFFQGMICGAARPLFAEMIPIMIMIMIAMMMMFLSVGMATEGYHDNLPSAHLDSAATPAPVPAPAPSSTHPNDTAAIRFPPPPPKFLLPPPLISFLICVRESQTGTRSGGCLSTGTTATWSMRTRRTSCCPCRVGGRTRGAATPSP